MFDVALYQPEIPPNTGNVIRLCANTGCRLHLVAPLGFELDHARLRRAAVDDHECVRRRVHDSFGALLQAVAPARVFAFTTRARRCYADVAFEAGDLLLFGPETRGLPQEVLEVLPTERCLRLPMRPGQRSLNLSNAVAVVVYEAWRQLGFDGGQ